MTTANIDAEPETRTLLDIGDGPLSIVFEQLSTPGVGIRSVAAGAQTCTALRDVLANWYMRHQTHEISAKDLDTMKKNAVGKDDKDINDDIVGGVNIGEARKQKAREGEEARQAEEDRYKQSAKDLAAMKKNTAARTDHDLLDDPV